MNVNIGFKETLNNTQLMLTFSKSTRSKLFTGSNTVKNPKNFSHLQKQQPQVNTLHVHHFVANRFSKQQDLQAPKPEKPLRLFTKSIVIVTMLSSY